MEPNSLRRLSTMLFGWRRSSQPATETPQGSVLSDHTSSHHSPFSKIGSTSPSTGQQRWPPERELSGFPGLPAEILLGIADHLDDATVICLSATSYRLSKVLASHAAGIRDRDLSRCAKWLIMAQLERGLVVDPRAKNTNIKLTCVLCKIRLAPTAFERYLPPTTAPNVMENGFENLRMLSRSPFARFCEHHAMCTVLGRESTDLLHNAEQPIRWECCKRRMCLHCGTVPTDGSQPSCNCICTVCPKDAEVPTFVRYGAARAGEKATDELRVFFLRFERATAGGGPLLAVERVHKRDDKKWHEAPVRKLAVEFR